ncbi:MAG: AI-2E family transporter [Rickettsiales bacterium]|jgi:predicted PurR-regulated permease PerM|nr:AI-2E family transporter [Rickettsiales bacterium]
MNWVLISMLIIGVLKFGQALIAPLLVAVFIWYLLNAVAEYYKRLMPAKAWWVGCASLAASIATFGIFALVFIQNIAPVVKQFQEKLPQIESKISGLISYIAKSIGFTLDMSWVPDAQRIFMSASLSVAELAASLGVVAIYVLFMFIEQHTFDKKLQHLMNNKDHYKRLHKILSKINSGIKRYLFVKTAISLSTAICSYIVMSIVGIDLALFWAFLIFILNYIPTFGSFIAVSLPVVYAFASLSPVAALWMSILLIGLQILFANILEPRIMGKTLNLSTLAILINLVFWGMMWGAVGMFFSVPLLVAAFIVASHIKKLRPAAVLISANGELPDDEK